jgi:hypothetical protein
MRRGHVATRSKTRGYILLQNENYWLSEANRSEGTSREFAEDWGVAQSTARQYLQQLRDAKKASIIRSKKGGGTKTRWRIKKGLIGSSSDQVFASSLLSSACGAISKKQQNSP